MPKVTDDDRILAALARGYNVEFRWFGAGGWNYSMDVATHPDSRSRVMAKSAERRLIHGGLIENKALSTRACDSGDWIPLCADGRRTCSGGPHQYLGRRDLQAAGEEARCGLLIE